VTTIAIRRFDPEADLQPRWATYSVAIGPRQTVLDALLTISDTVDPSLAFRRMCRSGICGCCGGIANGRRLLFCEAHIGDFGEFKAAPADVQAEIVIEPLAGFRVLKDLVVDMEPFFNELGSLECWLIPEQGYEGVMSKADAQRLWGAVRCVLCGICASDGLSSPPEPHAASVAHVLRFARDPRDAKGATRLSALDGPKRYDRRFADALAAICPKHVDINPLLPD